MQSIHCQCSPQLVCFHWCMYIANHECELLISRPTQPACLLLASYSAVVNNMSCISLPGHIVLPKPRNATFGSSVTFNASCVYCDEFAWKFNELYQDDPTLADLHTQVTTRSSDRPDTAYDSITIHSTLSLLARREGTITSVAVSHSGRSDVSPGVVLLVQGTCITLLLCCMYHGCDVSWLQCKTQQQAVNTHV